MKILFDIGHPAHVHFFRNPIRILKNHGHEIVVTSRKKEFALELLDELDLQHIPISSLGSNGILSLAWELITRDLALLKVVRQCNPDIMVAIGGIFIAHVSKFTGIPSLVFYDTENAKLQNALTYPFASSVIVPRCYSAWLPRKRHIRYDGYHELSYLHPNYFQPNRNIAIRNGLSTTKDTFFIRQVSWQANHDIGEKGWSTDLTVKLVDKLRHLGKILISSECPLPKELDKYRYKGRLADIHHVMAYCRLFVGESATMASESALLGVPAIYIAKTGRGYTTEQEKRYGLVKNIFNFDWCKLNDTIDKQLDISKKVSQKRKAKLINDTIDVAAFVVKCIETYPGPLNDYQETMGY